MARISWKDSGLEHEKYLAMIEDIAKMIHTELNGIPKELQLDFYVMDKKDDQKDILYKVYINGRAMEKF